MTNKPTPTPGPWRLGVDEPNYLWSLHVFADDNPASNILWVQSSEDDAQNAEYAPDLATARANARLIVSSCNAVQSLASHINRDPVALAKELEDGGMVELVEAVDRLDDALAEWAISRATGDLDLECDKANKIPPAFKPLRAILSRLRECGG